MFSADSTQVSNAVNYIEDVFSTYLYTGNGSTQTIINGIDLSTYGGLWWGKGRSNPGNLGGHGLVDTVRGKGKMLQSNTTGAQFVTAGNEFVTSFNTNGVTIGNDNTFNRSAELTVGWTFRKQPKFFDVVTYTGNATSGQAIAHSLGATPGAIFIKRTDSTSNWGGWVRTSDTSGAGAISLNTTAASAQNLPTSYIGTSTVFYPYWIQDQDTNIGNINGATYVAYLFAHNAGGFGLTGTDNVISCGSFTTDGSGNATVNLGYEPQWILTKASSASGAGNSWCVVDSMRGNATLNGSNATEQTLFPNLSSAEGSSYGYSNPTSTGFVASGWGATPITFVYIAIRRGPMKVPTSGTSVFAPVLSASSTPNFVTNFPVDFSIVSYRTGTSNNYAMSRLQGGSVAAGGPFLQTYLTAAEQTGGSAVAFDIQNGFGNGFGTIPVGWNFQRAPSFFDEVCYTGNGTNGRAVTHNLGVAPEMIIVKKRTGADGWVVWASGLTSRLYELYLNDPRAQFVEVSPRLNVNNAPTSTQFEVGTDGEVNASGATYVSYLFATCAGVSKVGSYTGNGSTQTIDCGFTGGARFVLIKRTDSTGDWYVYDTARGMTTLVDPYLLLNSTAAESATLGSVTTVSTGFALNAGILAAINTNGASYIFLAIA